MTKRVLVVGLVGYNFGDEAIAVSFCRNIKRYHNVQVKCVSLNRGALLKYGIDELYFVPRSFVSWLRLCFTMISSDYVFFGGGSLIQDKLGAGRYSGVLGYLNLTTMLASLLRVKIYSLPLGIDNVSRPNVPVVRSILSRFKELSVRDHLSYENALTYSQGDFLDLGVWPDLAYLIESSDKTVEFESYIVVSLAKENSVNSGDEIYSGVVEFIKKSIVDGLDVFLLAMDSRPDDELSLYYDIVRDVNSSKVKIFLSEDVFEISALLKNASGLLAMRLHAMILAIGFCDIFCLSRTTKTHAFCIENDIQYIDIESDKPESCWFKNIRFNVLENTSSYRKRRDQCKVKCISYFESLPL